MNRMKERLFVATFSENAIAEIRKYGLNIEFDHLCISENLNAENIGRTLMTMRKDRDVPVRTERCARSVYRTECLFCRSEGETAYQRAL